MRHYAAVVVLSACAAWRGPSTDKSGPMMFNVKAGPAIGLKDTGGTGRPAFSTAAVAVEMGFAVTPDRRGYIVVAPQVQPGVWYAAYMLPVGFQYDFKLSLRGPYLTARLSGGYALVEPYLQSRLLNFGFVLPELGIKHVIRKRWNLGFDFFSLPIGFGRDDNGVSIVALFYRLTLYAGLNF
ncbi:MAG: hypothetical protein JWM53_4299 [bacterium]|nr:hypothetical protein [bacterium]